jgi:hypothetical protein
MPVRAKLVNFFRNLFFRRRVEKELDDELIAYMDELAERHARQGLDPDEARRTAIAEIGSVENIAEQVRAQRVRMTGRTAVLTCAAMLMFTVTISAQTDLFYWIDRWLIGPFSPVPNHFGFATPDPRAGGYYIVSSSRPPMDKWVGTWTGTRFTVYSKTEPHTMKIEVVPGGLQITREGFGAAGKTMRESYTAVLDGNVLGLANRITEIFTHVENYTFENVANPYNKDTRERFQLYPDGKQLEISSFGTDRTGQRPLFRGGEYRKQQ